MSLTRSKLQRSKPLDLVLQGPLVPSQGGVSSGHPNLTHQHPLPICEREGG